MRIYYQNLTTLTLCVLASLVISSTLFFMGRHKQKLTKAVCAVLFLAALYGVLKYSVLGRAPSDHHIFVFINRYTNDFYRELFMNALLYYPFGLTLAAFIGPWSILAAFLCSFAVETWQYIAGTGLAQGTDVILNMLGCAIGTLPWIIHKSIRKRI